MAAITLLALCGGCATTEETSNEDTDILGSNVITTNGMTLNGSSINGSSINGSSINGSSINGSSINGSSINGSSINGSSINGVFLQGSSIIALTKKKYHPLSGPELIGAKLNAELQDGTDVILRIDGHEQEKSKLTGETIHKYVIAFTVPGSNTWAHVCGLEENGTPRKTIALRGRWNYGQGVPGGGSKINDWDAITFACRGFGLYKCVELGYEPWVKYKHKTWLDDHHQACTRMIRADYCGDGESWTVDGTVIDVYDNLGLQKDTENWPKEAEWDEDGARCLSHQRIQNMSVVPSCSFERSATKCGNPPQWSKTLLMTEAL